MNRSRMQGLTLVELMVSMVLGLIVIGGAVSLTLANRQSYRANEGLSQVEESARTAFELLARDIRQAGASGCDNEGRISNVINSGDWWSEWFGLRGFDGAEATSGSFAAYGVNRTERVAGTDALQLQGLLGNGLSVDAHNPNTAVITMAVSSGDIAVGDVVIACNFDHAAIFEITAAATPNLTHDTGVGTRNCSRGLGFPTDCSTATGNTYPLTRNTQLWRFFAVDWYIGQSGRTEDGGMSLFRRRLGPGGAETTEEIVTGISDMQVFYRRGSNDTDLFVPADAAWTVADWGQVNAVRIELTAESADSNIAVAGSGADRRLQRQYVQTITLRNRVP